MDTLKQDLLDELDAFDPGYRDHYPSLAAAARAAGPYALDLYWQFLRTPEGQALQAQIVTKVDWNAVNDRNKQQAQAELGMAAAANGGDAFAGAARDGYDPTYEDS